MTEARIEDFTLSGVALSEVEYLGVRALEMRMPVSEYQDPARDTLRDRNFMAWLPTDFSNGTIEVELASDLDEHAPGYARGFIGLAYRIDADGRFESIYVRPTNSTCDDQVRRNHTTQYVAYPDFPFSRLRSEEPEKYESHANLELGRWFKMRLEIDGVRAALYLYDQRNPSLVVNDMKLGESQRGGVGVWLESGTVAKFRNLRITSR